MNRERLFINREQVELRIDSHGFPEIVAVIPEGEFVYDFTIDPNTTSHHAIDVFERSENCAFGVAIDLDAFYLEDDGYLKFEDAKEGVYKRKEVKNG